ncbi:hypothetical protein E4631_11815 [Hymenobacter sp. UV11]|uniref:hypothetical protein n=1 Tax=Hymenobacter sp. UV11 TaxID=1849735 RepID=UPI00105D198B|nr:hypothetical protein [Hymenobacter sp. UV11]TDN40312.1 hypothetical protein A8B98_12755 [Hymenobacter sp. UV11]TFZ66689.1 hypothetical protein E4631_11815 [Hymenobacter sp. UV11]
MRFLLKLLLFLPLLAQAQTPAAANKQLFDRTIDELNFRTFETVYDKHFTRQKYPENLRTAAARQQFANFENNAELQKLFQNYNGVAERYKTRFGNGPLTLAEFEKQLSGVLRDRNFEFFIRGLPRDEKSALIRNEQRAIKQALARFNASANPATAKPATAEPEEPLAAPAPLTTNGPAPGYDAAPARPSADPEIRPTGGALAEEAPTPSDGPGWVGYLTLLLSLGSFGLLLYLVANLLPEQRRLRRRVRDLEAEQAYYPPANDEAPTDAPDYPTPPAERGPSFFSRFRPQSTGELPADEYDEDEEHN